MTTAPSPVPHLQTLTHYKAWADACLYAALAPLPVAILAAPTPIFAGNILRTLNHVRLIDVVWQAHLLGVAHGFATRNPESAPPLAELHGRQRELDAWFVAYAAALTPDRAGEVVDFTFIGGGAGALRREDIVLHVVNHTTYHRGHVTAMLRLAGITPPVTDLPVFLRDTSPLRE